MTKVVYLVGAGFSAPLGLPVMRNFVVKSKDMLALHPKEFAHFEKVFALIKDMSAAKNYYSADLFNIEEILSILEMSERVGRRSTKRFIRYIIDVITFYTPPTPEVRPSHLPANWYDRLMMKNPEWTPYFFFALTLLRVRLRLDTSMSNPVVHADPALKTNVDYAVITLNYDLVFETTAKFLGTFFIGGNRFGFHSDFTANQPKDIQVTALGKLHRSIDDEGSVIAPTWNKTISKRMLATWSAAHQLLQSANELRIIGYSLPVADAYIKYLLKSAVIDSDHLKHIDIICRDVDGATRARYKEFITFKYARFADSPVESYLGSVKDRTIAGRIDDQQFDFNQLESAHSDFFEQEATDL
jgi:hypothetical protein